jgi:hypothetical protein
VQINTSVFSCQKDVVEESSIVSSKLCFVWFVFDAKNTESNEVTEIQDISSRCC